MSAKVAEKLAEVADLHAKLGEAYTELSALYDVESAKSGKAGGNGAAGKVPGKGAKAGVASAKDGGDEDDLPAAKAAGKAAKAGKSKKAVTEDDVRASAAALIKAKGKQAAVDILAEYGSGKLADVEEENYAECKAKLDAALEEEDEPEADDADDI